MTRKRKILLAFLAVLVLIQFFPINKTNPPADPKLDFITQMAPPEEVAELFKSACYDCHSNHTEYPWYANIQPVGWWLRGHIKGARKELNFSEWGTYSEKRKARKFEEIVEEVEEHEMPLKSYTWAHPDARLTDAQRKRIVYWIKN